jgi:SAM-dependent methyltransferase
MKPIARLKAAAASWVDLESALLKGALVDVAPMAHGRLLDVGCGAKPYEEIFAPHVTEYVGIEYRETFSDTAASTVAEGAGGKGPDHYYDGTRMPFEDGAFDTVVSFQVLEHTPDPEGLLREMARVTKKGGLLILTAPFSFRLHEEPHDYFRFTPHGLKWLCAKVGFEVRTVTARGSLWSLIGHKLNTFLAFDVAGARAAAMDAGSGRQEKSEQGKTRLWTLPFVAPAMIGIGGMARLLDRAANVPTETLGYVVIATKA